MSYARDDFGKGRIYATKVDWWIALILIFTVAVLIGSAVPFFIGPPAQSPLGLGIGVLCLALAVWTGRIPFSDPPYHEQLRAWREKHQAYWHEMEQDTSIYVLPQFIGSLTGRFVVGPDASYLERKWSVFESVHDGKKVALQYFLSMLTHVLMRKDLAPQTEGLLANSGLPPETLIEVGDDHRLADPAPLEKMLELCERLATM